MTESKWISGGYTIITSEPVDFWVTRYIIAYYRRDGKNEGVVDISPGLICGSQPVSYIIREVVDADLSTPIDTTHIPDDPNRRKNNAYNEELIERNVMNSTMTTEAAIEMMSKLATRRGFVYGVVATLGVQHVSKKLYNKAATYVKG